MKQFECSLTHANMERVGIYRIEDVLPFVVENKSSEGAVKMYDGHEVKMWSLRYKTFKNSLSCVSCGIKGKYFALERAKENNNSERYHFNLYAKLDNGDEVLMTKDHIDPKSLGGKDEIKNMQTMCKVCNEIKMNRVESDFLGHKIEVETMILPPERPFGIIGKITNKILKFIHDHIDSSVVYFNTDIKKEEK